MNTCPDRSTKKLLLEAHDAEPADIHPTKWLDVSADSLLDAAPDAMLVINRTGEIVVANLQAGRLFRYQREELIGRSVESLIPRQFCTEHPQAWETFIGDPPVQPTGILDLFALRKDGSEVPVDISLIPLTNEAGTFVVAAIRDATDRRRKEGLKMLNAVLRETCENGERFSTTPAFIRMSSVDNLSETRAAKRLYSLEEAIMSCRSCGSEKQRNFVAEMMIHFSGRRNLDRPGVLTFPKLAVCLGCGFCEFSLEESALPVLEEGTAA